MSASEDALDEENGDFQENRERLEAEFEMIQAAYSPEEAWIVMETKEEVVHRRVVRRLELPIGDDSTSNSSSNIPLELVLTPPPGYPSDERAILRVDASLAGSTISHSRNPSSSITAPTKNSSSSSGYRKRALDALPNLLQCCRTVASEQAGFESIFAILSRAEQWIDEEWPGLCNGTVSGSTKDSLETTATTAAQKTVAPEGLQLRVGRKLIYSHHIIAKSKRKAIQDTAKEFDLGGYYKIGWPGIIIVEGNNDDCQSFYDTIKRLRWQHLELRGETSEPVVSATGSTNCSTGKELIDNLRRFPKFMTELDESKMSELAEICRNAGLEDLFLTSMKIYKQDSEEHVSNNQSDGTANDSKEDNICYSYGALIHVDHMNDPKGYTKWLQKACKSAGCSGTVHRCVPTASRENGNLETPRLSKTHGQARPLILVVLLGQEESSVKQVLKRWRTSRVDVDSRGSPCLERMMNVWIHGSTNASLSEMKQDHSYKNTNDSVTFDELTTTLESIGGASWVQALRDSIQK